ncbi:uncharacterized protein HGUI_02059 [Hanseniaspora guilliermondii]|uniref:Uncharacterized protein n=1 Tax=Hanseniaspora guilliermondii TaxID=56406 RepID=A0A1L0B4A5_9ASCO|nr:uncharacterized protein HGUI_02059 [Hanseniaspora guilliermondii]
MNQREKEYLFRHATKNLGYVALIAMCTAIAVKSTNKIRRENKFNNQGERTADDVKLGRGLEDDETYLEYFKQQAKVNNTENKLSRTYTDDLYAQQLKTRKERHNYSYSILEDFFGFGKKE